MVDLQRGRPRARAGRLGHARRRQLGQEGGPHRAQGQPDGGVRSGDDRRPLLSDSRHRHRGARERRHQRRDGRIGTGAGVGAIIGGILGGAKGALAGILIGGGGTIAATEGKDVELPPGTVLRVRLDSALELCDKGRSGLEGHEGLRPSDLPAPQAFAPALALPSSPPAPPRSSCPHPSPCAPPRETTPRTVTAADRCRARASLGRTARSGSVFALVAD